MNQTFRKTALLVSAMALLGTGYSTNAHAAGAPQEVQQATKKITGSVVDAMGPVIGNRVQRSLYRSSDSKLRKSRLVIRTTSRLR